MFQTRKEIIMKDVDKAWYHSDRNMDEVFISFNDLIKSLESLFNDYGKDDFAFLISTYRMMLEEEKADKFQTKLREGE